jgi:histidine ammonia-lyase
MVVSIGSELTFEDVVSVATGSARVDIAPGVEEKMAPARRRIEEAVESGATIYGITTGFGGLSNVRIDPAEAERLQRDIVRSHATAVGPEVPTEVVRAMLLLRARTFAFGISGVRFDILELLVAFLNAGIHPIVPAQGSLGASGDLALLAHLALPLLGEGEVEMTGTRMPAADALRSANLSPLELSFKEGLALVNGTEAMLAYGVLVCERAERLARAADITGAMTLEACLGTDRAFDEELIALRKHPGAPPVAGNLRRMLADSEIVHSHRESDHLVQDAYSLRCIPQVHGAYRDGIDYVRRTLEAELASAIDNPSVMPSGEVLSGGNFHGEALGLALDHLGLCLTGYGTIAERRIARLVDPQLNNGLPAFLTPDPGRRSGFMLAQYTAASLVSESRSMCFPASSDSIPTSAGQEDHVSMGATSARKSASILANSEHVIAIEALAAAQGIDLRDPLRPGPGSAAARDAVRTVSPVLDEDRPLAGDIERARGLLRDGTLEAAVAAAIGELD